MSKKNRLLKGFLILSLIAGFSSCIDEPKPTSDSIETFSKEELSKAKIALAMEATAARAAKIKQGAISPQTGRDLKYTYEVDHIVFDKNTQEASVDAVLSWNARESLFGKWGKCEVAGRLLVNFANRKSGLISASFIPTQCNEWAKICANSYGEDEKHVLNPITFAPYK